MARVKKTETEKIVETAAGIPDVVFIRKINKLAKLTRGNNGLQKPKFFGQENYDPDSESADDVQLEYKSQGLVGVVRNLTPQWDKLNQKWAWEGTFQDLVRIAKRMRLRDKDQSIILPEDEYCFTNREDVFFNHLDLWYDKDGLSITDGSIALRTVNAKEEFYARTYMGNPMHQNSMKEQPKGILSGSELEVWSPKTEIKTKKRKIDKQHKAITLLATMSIDKRRLIAQIMRPSGFDPMTEDIDLLYTELATGAAENTATATKFGGKTWQEYFIELGEMKDATLYITARIMHGKHQGILIKKSGMYTFQTKKLDGVTNDIQLVEYFSNTDRVDEYNKLDELLDD